jgi:hypothetical protein
MADRAIERPELRRNAGRALLAIFGVAEVVVGIWAMAFPRQFFDRFPGFGWHWVSASGPYDEHLVRDFGGALAGLAVVALICAARPARSLLIAMAAGWTAEAVPHFVYHLMHQETLPAGQDALNLVVLGLTVVVPLLAGGLLWPGIDRPRAVSADAARRSAS